MKVCWNYFLQWITDIVSERVMNDKGVCRTAPSLPGLWNMHVWNSQLHITTVHCTSQQHIKLQCTLHWCVTVCSKYSDIRIYSNIYWQIYTFAQIFVNFFRANIFRYSYDTFFSLMNIFGHSFGLLNFNEDI